MRSLLLTIVFSVLAVGPAGAVSTHDNSARFLAQRTYSSHLKANLSEISEMPQGIKSLAKFKRKSSTARPLLGQRDSTSRPQKEASIPRSQGSSPERSVFLSGRRGKISHKVSHADEYTNASLPSFNDSGSNSSIHQQKNAILLRQKPLEARLMDAIFPGRKDRVPYLPRSQGSSPKHSRFFPGRG